MGMSMWIDIEEFHQKFGLPSRREFNEEILDFRIRFMQEELQEFVAACKKEDMVEAFDALIDLAYVVLGTAKFMDLPFREGWNVVHNANMKKRRAKMSGADSKRKSRYDVVKPEGWKSPNKALKLLIEGIDDPYVGVHLR